MYVRRVMSLALTAAMLVALSIATPAAAQTTGIVTGAVTDPQDKRIPGATVVLINEAQGTKSTPVITNNEGVYTFPTVVPGTYTVEISLSGFKTIQRKGVSVSRGDRVQVEAIGLAASGVTASIDVVDAAPLVQAASGERSSTVNRTQLENLPSATGAADHNFIGYIELMPGIGTSNTGTQQRRIGGGGQDNVMLDGLSALDTGNNGIMSGMNLPIDAIAEIKVVTSGYSAEYGRSSGVQVSAITRSGTNRFHGSVYDYERDSDWNANSWAGRANGTARTVSKQRDWGYTIGGPIGKPGGDNKLFFFYTQEFRPRTQGGGDTNYRMPTALERMGDFSETRDNNNALYNFIYDPTRGQALGVAPNKANCSATNQTQCFADGGKLGKIPVSRLYGPGLAWLNSLPLPNNTPPTTGSTQNYNHTVIAPVQNQLSWTPNVKVDYQMLSALRLTWRISAASSRILPGGQNLPEWNGSVQNFPLSFNTSWAVNYTVNPTTFIEGSYGVNQNRLGSPSIAKYSNRTNMVCPAELAAQVSNCTGAAFPFLFPDAGQINTNAYEYEALRTIGVPFLGESTEPCVNGDEVGQTCGRLLLPPTINWGGTRIANSPPSIGFPGFMNINRIQQTNVSVTKILGNHNLKAGLYYEHSYKAQNAAYNLSFQGALNVGVDTNNPLDSQMAFSNMALGIFSTYGQGSRFIEGNWAYNNVEFFLQDNWKVTPRLTLDYGVRFANDGPYADKFNHVANFFAPGNGMDAGAPASALWSLANAPTLYVPGCVNNTATCTGSNRVAKDPRNGALLPAGSTGLVGSVILDGTGKLDNGMIVGGQQGTNDAGYTWPVLAVAPRVGAAYDVAGDQKMVLRGAVGLYFDRPDGNTAFGTVTNPPVGAGLSQQWGDLRALNSASLKFGPVSTIIVNKYDSAIPKDIQWNLGVQRVLPWSSSIDVSYVGHHQYESLGGTQNGNPVNINTIDLGTTFLASSIDTTNTTAGTALSNNLLRAYRGYGDIRIQWPRFGRDFHSIQTTLSRSFRDGFSLQFTDTWTLSDKGTVGLPDNQLRINHNADGSWYIRDDQAEFEELFGDQGTMTHQASLNWVYDLPDTHFENKIMKAVGLVINDWQLSGILSMDSGGRYAPGYSYNSGPTGQALTGSPNYNARLKFTDLDALGSGCSSNQYQQLGNTIVSSGLSTAGQLFRSTAIAGPQVGSTGLESGRFPLTGCKDHTIDLAIQRTIKLGGNRSLQLRADLFNAFNTVVYTGRSSTVQFNSTTDQTVRSSQYLQDGTLDPARVRPNQAAFGAVTGASSLRSVQGQVRFQF